MLHTVTAEDGSFDSEMIAAGGSWVRTFEAAGTFHYVCSFHPEMEGVVDRSRPEPKPWAPVQHRRRVQPAAVVSPPSEPVASSPPEPATAPVAARAGIANGELMARIGIVGLLLGGAWSSSPARSAARRIAEPVVIRRPDALDPAGQDGTFGSDLDARGEDRDPSRDMGRIERKRLDAPDEVLEFPLLSVNLVRVSSLTVGLGTVQPGFRWSTHVRKETDEPLCQVHHLQLLLSGRFAVEMADGEYVEIGPNEIFDVPPGHDAWVLGDEPAVLLDFLGNIDQLGVPRARIGS